jgi:hypothetical protein
MRILALMGVLVIVTVAMAQTRSNVCNPEIPRYQNWAKQQQMSYIAPAQRQKELTINYAKMNLGMSQQETIGQLGSPDYAIDGSPDPTQITCIWGYALEESRNQSGSRHQGILVAFNGNGSVVVLEPEGLPHLKPLREVNKSCKSDLVNYAAWFRSTGLPQGQAYSIDPGRKSQIVARYPRLTLGMNRSEAQDLLGKPDFEEITRLGAQKDVWNPKQVCTRQLAYMVTQIGDNLTDPNSVGLFLSFDEEDKLFWASPQNIPGLKALGSPVQ